MNTRHPPPSPLSVICFRQRTKDIFTCIVDGEWDPWRAATPHALGQPDRQSTISEPYILIEKAVHHWDENGVWPNETTPDFPPPAVQEAQKVLREAVVAWVDEYKEAK